VMFGDAVEWDGRLWLSAREGARAVLASLDGHDLQFHDPPHPGLSVGGLAVLNGEMVLGGDRLTIGQPGAWRDLPLPGMPSEAGVVALVSAGAGGELCAISNTGQSWFTDGRTARPVPVF
jgi:hypothetical protein